jgi:hypothetical protein
MKYLIAAIFLTVSIQSFGQFNKGDKVLGGTLSLNLAKNENSQFGTVNTNNNSFDIYPNFGVLINSNLEIGGYLGYSSSHEEWSVTNTSSDRKSHSLSTGVYVQRYFVISDKFLFSLIGNISYGGGKEKTSLVNQNDIVEDENKWNSIGVTFRPSFIFFPSPNWALQASIGDLSYTHTKNKTNDDTSNRFGINYGYVGFGIAYYFRRNVE